VWGVEVGVVVPHGWVLLALLSSCVGDVLYTRECAGVEVVVVVVGVVVVLGVVVVVVGGRGMYGWRWCWWLLLLLGGVDVGLDTRSERR